MKVAYWEGSRGGHVSALLDSSGWQTRRSEAGAEEAQQGVWSTVITTLIPTLAASETRRSMKASEAEEYCPGASGSTFDQGTSLRTTWAWRAWAWAIA